MGHAQSPATVVLVADGGPEHGLGHIHRSTALAVALATRGIRTSCFAHGASAPLERDEVRWEPLGFGIGPAGVLVLDSYELALDDLGGAAKIVVLHDHLEPPVEAELVVSAAADPADADERHLYGPRFACLRPAFWGLPPREPGSVGRILVSTGGGNGANAGAALAEAVRDALPEAEVALALGALAGTHSPDGVELLPPQGSLASELLRADLVVTAAGQTMLEAAATGAPTIAIPIVANQRRQAERLGAAGAARVVDAGEVADAARDLAADAEARAGLSRSAQGAVDGYGALRVAFRIDRLVRAQAGGA